MCDFRGDDLLGRDPSPVDMFDSPELIGFQTDGIAKNLANGTLLCSNFNTMEESSQSSLFLPGLPIFQQKFLESAQ
jgi:hypothetical protein